MRRLFIEVDEAAFRTIADLATAERRPTRDQIAVLLEQAAKRLALQRSQDQQDRRDGGALPLTATGAEGCSAHG